MRTEIRPARPEDIAIYTGFTPRQTWFGIAAEVEGVVVGLGGVMWFDEGAYVFFHCDQTFMPGPYRAHRLALHVIDIAHRAGETCLYVMRSANVPTSERWLSALGFTFSHMRNSSEVWKRCQV